MESKYPDETLRMREMNGPYYDTVIITAHGSCCCFCIFTDDLRGMDALSRNITLIRKYLPPFSLAATLKGKNLLLL